MGNKNKIAPNLPTIKDIIAAIAPTKKNPFIKTNKVKIIPITSMAVAGEMGAVLFLATKIALIKDRNTEKAGIKEIIINGIIAKSVNSSDKPDTL